MPRMRALFLALIFATAAAASLGPAQAARLGYSRGSCLSEALPAVEAVSACTAVLQKFKNNAAVLLRRGVAFGELGAFDYAIGDFSRAIRLAPDHALALRLRGLAYEMQGQASQSLADYLRLRDLGRSDADLEAAIRRITEPHAGLDGPAAPAPQPAQLPSPEVAKSVAAVEPPKLAASDRSRASVAPWVALPAALLVCAGAALLLWRSRRRRDNFAV
jgi:tetratricopeptide (TPR) repeat protein